MAAAQRPGGGGQAKICQFKLVLLGGYTDQPFSNCNSPLFTGETNVPGTQGQTGLSCP